MARYLYSSIEEVKLWWYGIVWEIYQRMFIIQGIRGVIYYHWYF